ncbi:MAG: hypothetical protein OXC99_09220 [Chloroflexi bacterium]|nr:hypothetical protein [Chloroflexota bacterium]
MGSESLGTAMDVQVNMSVAFATAGFMLRKGRSARRNAAGKGFALLAEARAVEHFAGTLLDDCGEDLALHDAIAPSKMKRPGFGKGITTARIAVVEAIGAQRAMEYGGMPARPTAV